MLLSCSFTPISFPSPKFALYQNRSPKRILKMAQSAHNPGKNFYFRAKNIQQGIDFIRNLGCFVNCIVSVGRQQKIIVPNKHGEKLVGLLHETGSEEIVILCHGFRSTKVGFCNICSVDFLFPFFLKFNSRFIFLFFGLKSSLIRML